MTVSSYPGNAALPAEVRQRVLSTFQQVAQTYLRGNMQEATVGCEFVLRIDPDFAPARQLATKIRNPEASLDVAAMLASLGSAATPSEASPLEAAQAALEARAFPRAAELANRVLRDDLTNVEAQRIANEAQEKIEADPFISQFLQSARQKLSGGNRSGAAAELDKAKQLDPRHPAVLDFERMMSSTPEPAPSAAPPSSFDFGFDSTPGLGSSGGDAFVPPPAQEAPQGGFDFGQAFSTGGTEPPASPSADSASEFSFGFSAEPPPAEEPPPTEESAPADETFAFGFDAATTSEPAPAEMPSFASFDSPAADPAPVDETAGFGGFGGTATSDTSSFVAPGESAASGSSDFGFTFEDDQKPQADSFASGFETPAAGEAQTFDFSTAAVETTEEDRAKIGQILSDGDAALDRGEYQEAIDIWSRIFLIDVTNEAATERIEKARRVKQEAERGIEGLMSEAAIAAERGDHAGARAKYEEVLRIDPSHMMARDGLDRLETSDAPFVPPPAIDEEWGDEGQTAPGFEPIAPPDAPPAKVSSAPATRPAAKKKGISGAVVAIAAVLVLAIVGGGAWWFLRSGAQESTVDAGAAIERGERLAAAGDFEGAIAALLTVPANDPRYGRSVQLLDEYRKLRADQIAASSQAGTVNFEQALQRGRAAFAAGDYIAAEQALTAAGSAQPLPADAAQMLAESQAKVRQLASIREMFANQRWDEAAAAIVPLRQQDPNNANLRDMLAAAHFNRGVTALRDSRTADAVQAFDAAVAVNPEDQMASRSRELAAKYDRENKDLLYEIYVKYLPLRTF